MTLIVLFVILFIIFVFHFLVYYFLIHAFSIENRKIRLTLCFVLFLLSVSFIASAVIAHKWENFLTQGFYNISALWYGLLINLLLVILFYWFFILIFLHLTASVRVGVYKKIIGKALIILALLYTVYGIYNAFFPNIKEINVNIKNLPIEWQGKRIVHLSDIHLGRTLGKNFLERIAEKVNNINPEIVLITGDLFDGMDGRLSSFVDLLNQIKSKKGTYYVTGNHETYLGLEEVFAILAKTNINVLNDRVVNVDGLQIIGISYPGNGGKDAQNIIKNDENFSLEKPSILLYHSPTNLFSFETSSGDWHRNIYWTPDVSFSVARNLGADLQLSGHTHRGQIFPFNFITHYIYGGYDYGLHQIEDFAIYITSGTGVWGPPVRTGGDSEIVVITLE
ncbi:hypothetical protein A2331_04905 [Candidatus Falkowbacteria bacterium RIFOXYB2_FULL_34_18]|uniref:Calcineurin-like phosphoesterase domain-containing protein n=1 Tax=Candidatus Falkowbacteria bacterium RIFOXYD2_FULL_34_120 TaxID=1798007 RepID=A0A1F5TND1_9BACT|nr:MAG: hypothetical protein A2331_04905 [Candidatus Falkowbacteria bacterium RIFOXYB2_FULL_34_18]OGF28841.1 MAG: hypothetical protein A2500_00470 [Candidatus Falkowbacteria bacterium RIFOXYC12_FULL_34_55]OGF35786.1 MAG: hypothetical protein A2466_04600 [Candidatus Falkowbacteria bacterium RIFOXYC2_FULL_34_220]OGF38452.1 MAG: hypothetical protein A2515_02040 [Candidatus Falkowbacteria bacterium RIFOXYD12_FULL_34_57]OGF40492.1 MAG: hypothetical protein A2531_02885 [Candidatus Falkowbacteria bact